MRSAIVLMLAALAAAPVAAQTPPVTPPPAAPGQPTDPAQAPRPRPRPAAPATAVITVTVTDVSGGPLADVKVTAVGPVEREGITTAVGQVRLLGIRSGTYRLRFEREGYHTFEKELVWKAGLPPVADATLTAAPPAPPPPPPAPEPSKPATPVFTPDLPAGKASNLSVLDYIERNHITNKEPQKESLIGCSAGAQTWLWQVREPWQNRRHDAAELMLYVIAGDGSLTLNGRDVQVAAGTFAVVPRGTEYGVTKRGRAPAMYLLATLSGPPCAQ